MKFDNENIIGNMNRAMKEAGFMVWINDCF